MATEPTDRKEAFPSPPAVWATMAKEVREYDQDNVKRGKGDVDTLLVFAGLFSAVLASFLVAVYPNLQPSPMDMMNYTLERIANQTASYNFTDGRLIATNPSSPPSHFRASSEDIRVNVLWFASLIISLITSSFGMLVKQWMDDFLAVDIPEPQARLRLRHHRAPQIEAWLVYEIVACLPLLLHLSLGLFFVGLCYFTSAVHASVGHTTLPLVIGWTLCLFVTTALPIFFPHCPYKISLFKPTVARIHRAASDLLQKRKPSATEHTKKQWLSHLSRLYSVFLVFMRRTLGRIQATRDSSDAWYWPDVYTRIARELSIHLMAVHNICMTALRSYLSRVNTTTGFTIALQKHSTRVYTGIARAIQNIPDEQKVLRDSSNDLEIFASIDAMRANDEILGAIVAEELPWIHPTTNDAVSFALEILAHRVQTVTESECLFPEWPFRDPFPLDSVRAQAKENILKILHNYVVCGPVSYDRSPISIALRQRDTLPDKEQRMILLALTMIISDVSSSSEVKLPSNIIDFLRYYLDSKDGPAVCRDVLTLITWHCTDVESCWTTTTRLITALAHLAAPLSLPWKDRLSCFKSILCLKITYPCGRLDPNPHPTYLWNYPEELGTWEDWNIASDTPDTLYNAAVGHMFVIVLSEFRHVESSNEPSPKDLHDETLQVLRCALRQFMCNTNALERVDAGIAPQAFVDLMSMKSKGLMDVVIEALVATDLADLQIQGTGPYSRWSNGARSAIRNKRIKPSNASPEESFKILSSLLTEKLNHLDTTLAESLSLCHIAIFLYLSLHTQPANPSLGTELFSSIATTLTQKSLTLSAEDIINDATTTLAYGCLYTMDFEDLRCSPDNRDEWREDVLRTGKTSFPDSLVGVLGKFVPEGKDELLFRLREWRNRVRSGVTSVEVLLIEQDEAMVDSVVDVLSEEADQGTVLELSESEEIEGGISEDAGEGSSSER